MKYDNIWNNFEFEGPRTRSECVAIFSYVIALALSFMDRFCCNFTQMLSMKNILIKFKFQLSRAKVNVKVAILRNMLLVVAFIYGLILI